MNIFKFFKRFIKQPENIVVDFRKFTSTEDISNINEFIAVDLETTGLSSYEDKILEIGAAHFKDGKIINKFNMLINPKIPISAKITSINGITNEMVKNEQCEYEVTKSFYDFVKVPASRGVIFCAHNANFDFGFLENAFNRNKISLSLKYMDTLQLAKLYIEDTKNYKQSTLEEYFNISNEKSHRALTDAMACGEIFISLIELYRLKRKDGPINYRKKKNIPTDEDLQVCAHILYFLKSRGVDIGTISFFRNSSKYVDIRVNGVNFLRFKIQKKGKYIICDKSRIDFNKYVNEDCTETEGGINYARIFFSNSMLLDRLSAYIFDSYNEGIERWNSILEYGLDDDFEEYLVNSTSIDEAEMNELLLEAKEIDDTVEVKTKEKIKIDQVVLTKKSERIPLNEIENIDDWDRGFDEGFPFYLEGEDERKAGNIKESIKLFDIAREKGYSAPALYRSYAMAYRKIKDYENEILILQEGIERDERHRDSLEGRLNKAIELLYKKQNSKK